MSKRFGRNQKRHMRDQIEAANAERDAWKDHYDTCKKLGARNADIVEETAHVLGRHFMTLDPESMEVRDLDSIRHDWRIPFIRSLPTTIGPADDMSLSDFTYVALPILRFSESCDELRMRQHFRFSYGGETVAYAVDYSALVGVPNRIAVDRIARDMAAFLLQSLAKKKAA